ncbi:MAG: hypothetical protein GX639_05600 [Fibrobacter sp.]|nr:hypothetical protein [Fibrobacter sp.]
MYRKIALLMVGVTALFFSAYCDDDDDEQEEIEITTDTVPYDMRTGGSGVFEIGLTKFNLEPVEKVVKSTIDIGGFDFDEDVLTTIGFMGYAGQRRNGMRLGFGAWGGYGGFYGDTWTVRSSPVDIARGRDSLIDSTIKMHVLFGHTGLVTEKSFKIDKLNLYVGGMIGVGGIIVVEERMKGNGAFYSASDDYDSDTSWWDDSESNETDDRYLGAAAWVFDIRGGFTHSFTKWLHAGIDGSALFYYSSRGFNSRYGGFWTANPSVRLRLVFGSST